MFLVRMWYVDVNISSQQHSIECYTSWSCALVDYVLYTKCFIIVITGGILSIYLMLLKG